MEPESVKSQAGAVPDDRGMIQLSQEELAFVTGGADSPGKIKTVNDNTSNVM